VANIAATAAISQLGPHSSTRLRLGAFCASAFAFAVWCSRFRFSLLQIEIQNKFKSKNLQMYEY
jgi:hypothetical protein